MLENPAETSPTADILGLRSLVNSRLRDLINSIKDSSLKPQLEYSLLSPGKRLRPIILLLSTYAVGGDIEKSIPLALSIEVLHTATLVHDDAIDQDRVRRGVPTVRSRWGVGDAILVGDALISLSTSLSSYYGPEIVRIIADTGFALSDAEHVETSSLLKTSTEKQYFKRIQGKSAVLFRTAAKCGAMAGGGSPREVDALAEFGERFGLAYQIRDDIEDLTEVGDKIPRDLRNKVPTLPIIHLYRNENTRIERLLERCFSGNVTIAESRQLITELEKSGSILYCEQKIKENLDAASKALSVTRLVEARDLLLSLSEIIIPNIGMLTK